MKNTIREERRGNYVVRVYQEEEPTDVREYHCGTKMVCFHNRYTLGDKHNYQKEDYNSWEELKEQIIKDNEGTIVLPLYLYDHSGLSISTTPFSCKWDSGQVGWIYSTENYVTSESMDIDVQTYDKYLKGEIYHYVVSKIEVCEKGHEHEEEIENIGGWFDIDDCLENGLLEIPEEHIV